LTLIGIEPGMRVLDVNAASGYYAEILARAVGPTGRVRRADVDGVPRYLLVR
jgi:predicted methyltransferase